MYSYFFSENQYNEVKINSINYKSKPVKLDKNVKIIAI